MQRIVIKNFGPIKDVDIPIHDFMIFIGPQASGKSTIAKAIYFFREIPDHIQYETILKLRDNRENLESVISHFFDEETRRKVIIEYFTAYFAANLHDSFYLQFFYSANLYITIAKTESQIISLEFSNELEALISEFKKGAISEVKQLKEENEANILSYRKVRDLLASLLFYSFGDRSVNLFIPAGRSIFSTLANQIHFKDDSFIDENIVSFADTLNGLREYGKINDPFYREPDTSSFKIAKEKIKEILKGDFVSDNGADMILIENIKSILLNYTSSGQQESIWMLLSILESIDSIGNNFLVVEEPEAHLYPESQKSISELISLCVNHPKNQAIITTHSPYILGAINNLIYSHYVGSKNEEKVNSRIPKELWLDYNRVATYFVDEGKVTDIMEEEREEKYGKLKMIKNDAIDSASRMINADYDFLSDTEFSV